MLPIVLTKKQNVLIVGAGKACQIKLKSLSKIETSITIVANTFLYELDSEIKKVNKNYYELSFEFFEPFDLIYIAIPLDDTSMLDRLLKTKLVNVLSNPKLGNFIHPCVRTDGDVMISVNSIKKANPKRVRELANKFLKDYLLTHCKH